MTTRPAIRTVCERHGIDHEWRPCTPRYGRQPQRVCVVCSTRVDDLDAPTPEATRADVIRFGLPAPRTAWDHTCTVCDRNHSQLPAVGQMTSSDRWRLADQICFTRSISGNAKHDYEAKYLRCVNRGLDLTEYGDPEVMSPGQCRGCGGYQCRCDQRGAEATVEDDQ